jgi:hypothetical protein
MFSGFSNLKLFLGAAKQLFEKKTFFMLQNILQEFKKNKKI